MQTKVPAPVSATTGQARQQQHQPEYEIDSAQLLRTPQFEDGRPEVTTQLYQQSLMANSPRTTQLQAMQAFMAAGTLAKQNHQASAAPITQRMEDEELLQSMAEEPVQREQAEAPATDPTSQDAPPSENPKPNNTGLPDQLKTGIENLSGMSMDHVKVHYNSDKPAQLQAHAYAQGSEIHVAPGQEQHLPHEAWHVVQQAEGRVKPTVQMKAGVEVNDDEGLEAEADLMGAKAMSAGGKITQDIQLKVGTSVAPSSFLIPSNVIQGKFGFRVNIDTYTIVDASYHRVQGVKYLTGNKENKHVTADTVKDSLWAGTEGMGLVAFGKRLLHVVDEYMHLPGLVLLEAHKLHDDDSPNNDGLTEAMIDNYKALEKCMSDIPFEASTLNIALHKFESAALVDEKNSAAFIFQNTALKLISSLEKFRDLMPLVNIVSGIQNPGREKEAKKFLKSGNPTKNVKNELDALWAFFDFAAISELIGEDKEQILHTLQDAQPWIDIDSFAILLCEKSGMEPQELDASDFINCVAGLMLGNHIKLIQLSYPNAAKKVNFDSFDNVMKALTKNDVPVDKEVVANIAAYGW